MSPVLRSFRQHGRRPFKNVLDRSGRVSSLKKRAQGSLTGKKSTPTDLSSVPSLYSPSKEPRIRALTHGEAPAKTITTVHKKPKNSSSSDRMTTRSSKIKSSSILSLDCSSSSGVVPISSISIPSSHDSRTQSDTSAVTESSCKEGRLKGVRKPQQSEQRVLRPREAPRPNLSALRAERRPFVEAKLLGRDDRNILNRRIKVWWPLDSCWYYGTVKKYDSVKGLYWIVYDDGDEEWLDLETEHCRLQTRSGEVLNQPQLRTIFDQHQTKKLEELRSNSHANGPLHKLRSNSHANKSLHHGSSKSAMDLDSSRNGTSSFQIPCKVTYVYTRRQSSRNQKTRRQKTVFEREPVDLSALRSRKTSPATRSCSHISEGGFKSSNLLAGNGCSVLQHPKSADARQEVNSSSAGSDSTAFITSSPECQNSSGFGEEPLKSHITGLFPAVHYSDDNQTTVNTAHFSNSFKQVISVLLNRTEIAMQALHPGSSGLIIPLPNIGRPEQIPMSKQLFIGCTRLAGDTLVLRHHTKNDLASKRSESNQASTCQLSMKVRKCSESPCRYLGPQQFFLQRIFLNVSSLIHVVIGQELRLAESNFYEGVFKNSLNRFRAKALIVKQSTRSQLMTDLSFCGDAVDFLLLKLQSSDFAKNFVGAKEMDRFDEVFNAGQSQLFDVDTRDSCDKVDWHLLSKRDRICTVGQSNSLDSYARGFDSNELSFIVAASENDDISQVEFKRRIGSMLLVVKVVCGGSFSLADILSSLQVTLGLGMIANEAVPNHLPCASRENSITSTKPAFVKTRDCVFGAGSSSRNFLSQGFIAVEKEVYGQSGEIRPPIFSVSEPLRPLLEEIWPLLFGKNGVCLSLSQILYFFLARNAIYMLGISSRIFQSGRSLEYLPGAELLSGNIHTKLVSKSSYFHLKKRPRSEKTSKYGATPSSENLVENIMGADRLPLSQVGRKLGKRRKVDTRSLIARTDEVQDTNNNLDQPKFGPSTSMLGKKSYILTSVFQPNHPQPLQSSNINEVLDFDAFVLEERKSNDSKQIGSCTDLDSLKIILNPLGDLRSESSASCHFQRNKHDCNTNFFESSERSVLYSCCNDLEKVTVMNGRRKRHDYRNGLETVDDSIQNHRRRQKRSRSSAIQTGLHCREEFYGRNHTFSSIDIGHKGYEALENMQFKDSETVPLNCSANLLHVQTDRGWRELGAKVELLLDNNTWVLSVSHHGECLVTQKAEQSAAFGSTNKYTHAMMWKGGKDWSLEFEDRRQWLIFKEMHELCFYRNARVASVRQIPIPGVRHVEESSMADFGHPFVRPERYLCQKQGELDAALSCSRALYDMDSEDENWVDQVNKAFATIKAGHLLNIKGDAFEALIDKLEKAAYANHQNTFSVDVALELCQGLGPDDIIKSVHSYWILKRSKKGMPLIRYFQPMPWEQYQRQLQRWEAEVTNIQKDSHLGHQSTSVALPPRPQGFAFCLRPRGLEVSNKVQKQRSQKKLGSTGTMPRYWTSAFRLDSTMDGDETRASPIDLQHDDHLFLGEDHFFGARYSSPGAKVRPGYGTNVPDEKHIKLLRQNFDSGGQRLNSKKAGKKAKTKRVSTTDEDFIPKRRGKSSKRLQMPHNLGVSMEILPQVINFGSSKSTALTSLANVVLPGTLQSKAGDADPVVLNMDSNNTVLPPSDLEAIALAKVAIARKAADVATRKRENAQVLYTFADLAMHKAVSAIIAAEAIEAEKRTSMALRYPDELSRLGVDSHRHTYIGDEVISPSNNLVGSKKMPKRGGGIVDAELFIPWRHCAKKTVLGSTNMVLRGSSFKKDLLINTDDALLPIPSWTQELGAGIGSKLIYRGEVSPQRSRIHASVLGSVSSNCASRCFEGVA